MSKNVNNDVSKDPPIGVPPQGGSSKEKKLSWNRMDIFLAQHDFILSDYQSIYLPKYIAHLGHKLWPNPLNRKKKTKSVWTAINNEKSRNPWFVFKYFWISYLWKSFQALSHLWNSSEDISSTWEINLWKTSGQLGMFKSLLKKSLSQLQKVQKMY